MLSSRSRGTPASTAPAASSSVAHSTSTVTPAGAFGEREPGRLPHPAGQQGVILLDEDRVVEAAAVAHAPAGPHGLLLERAHAGGGLARVEDRHAGPLDRRHVRGRERCHPGQPAEKVEGHPLAGEDRRGVALHGGQQSRLAPAGRLSLSGEPKRRIHPREDRFGDLEACRHTGLLLHDPRPRPRAARHHGARGQIPVAEVLRQRRLNQVLHGWTPASMSRSMH